MSIPQICPSCGSHISAAHAKDCCYGTPEYAHLGWSKYIQSPILRQETVNPVSAMEELSKDDFVDSASAIRRLLAYLEDETDEEQLPPEPSTPPTPNKYDECIYRLAGRAEELRKEAAGMYNIEARAKRNFAADVLDNLISELSE